MPLNSTRGGASAKGFGLTAGKPPFEATGGTVTTYGAYTVHTFTGPGTFTTNANFGIASAYSVN